MTARYRSALEVSHGALLDLETAKGTLELIESLLYFVSREKELPQSSRHANNLIDVAWSLAADAANTASCNYEQISQALDKFAPQNTESKNVARDSEVQS